MPLHQSIDAKAVKTRNQFYQWGTTGKRYYFMRNSVRSETMAKNKAMRQARAIERSKHLRR